MRQQGIKTAEQKTEHGIAKFMQKTYAFNQLSLGQENLQLELCNTYI